MYEGGERKIAKLFPTYLMNPANRQTFHPQNFCHLWYCKKKGLAISKNELAIANNIIVTVSENFGLISTDRSPSR